MSWRSVSPETLLNFLRATAAVTFVVEADGYVLDVPEWVALTGQPPSEALGDGWLRMIHPEDVSRVSAAWKTAVSHEMSYNTDYRLLCADGSYRWFNARAEPVMGRDGRTSKWVGVILAIPGGSRPSRGVANADRPSRADRFSDISPAALRAARAMLQWSADQMAAESGIARSTLRRLEGGEDTTTPRKASIAKILTVLSREGLLFIGHNGMIVGVIDHHGQIVAE